MADVTAVALPVLGDPLNQTQARERLRSLKAMLEGQGVTSLSSLGTLSIAGSVVPQAGLTVPTPTLSSISTLFQGARAPLSAPVAGQSELALRTIGGTAQVMTTKPGSSPGTAAATTIPLNTAY